MSTEKAIEKINSRLAIHDKYREGIVKELDILNEKLGEKQNPNLKKGNWYTHTSPAKTIICITKIHPNTIWGYGFRSNGEWFVLHVLGWRSKPNQEDFWTPITNKDIRRVLKCIQPILCPEDRDKAVEELKMILSAK